MIHSIGGDGVICLHDKFLAEKIIFPPMVDVEECEHDFLVIIVHMFWLGSTIHKIGEISSTSV